MEGGDVLEVEDESKMIGNKRGRGNDENLGGITTRLEKKPSGMMMVNQVFDQLQQEEKVKEHNTNYDYSGDEMINGVKYEEEKDTTPTPSPGANKTGLFNQFITNLVNNNNNNSPESNIETHDNDDESKKNDHVGGEGEGGGVINDFFSNIFTSNHIGKEVVVVEKDSVVDGAQVVDDVGDGQNEKDGVIDNIVAQLPRTLSEDTAPATDEASILIHSIIHD